MSNHRMAMMIAALGIIAACPSRGSAEAFTIRGGGLNGCSGSFGTAFGPESSSSTASDQASGLCLDGTMTVGASAGPGFLGGCVFDTWHGNGNASLATTGSNFSGSFFIVDPIDEMVGISMNLFLNGSQSYRAWAEGRSRLI